VLESGVMTIFAAEIVAVVMTALLVDRYIQGGSKRAASVHSCGSKRIHNRQIIAGEITCVEEELAECSKLEYCSGGNKLKYYTCLRRQERRLRNNLFYRGGNNVVAKIAPRNLQ